MSTFSLRRMGKAILPEVPAILADMHTRVSQVEEAIKVNAARLERDKNLLGTWTDTLLGLTEERDEAKAVHDDARAKHDAGEMDVVTFINMRDRWWRVRDRCEVKIPEAEEKIKHYSALVDRWFAEEERLKEQKAGLEKVLGLSDVYVAWKKAANAWYAACDGLMGEDEAGFLFGGDLADDASELYEINELLSVKKARAAHLADKLRRAIQRKPQGHRPTDNDTYPSAVYEGPKGRYLVQVQTAPRYYYDIKDVRKLLNNPDFAPDWTTIDKVEFESALRKEQVRKADGTPLTLDEAKVKMKTETTTPHVRVRRLGPDEDPNITFIPNAVANQALGFLGDLDLEDDVVDMHKPREEEAPEEAEKRLRPSKIRHLLGVSRKGLVGLIGAERTETLMGKIFG